MDAQHEIFKRGLAIVLDCYATLAAIARSDDNVNVPIIAVGEIASSLLDVIEQSVKDAGGSFMLFPPHESALQEFLQHAQAMNDHVEFELAELGGPKDANPEKDPEKKTTKKGRKSNQKAPNDVESNSPGSGPDQQNDGED